MRDRRQVRLGVVGTALITIAISAALTGEISLWAQQAAPAGVDAPKLLRDLETLSSDAMEGRLTGTPGSAKARAYIVQRFKDVGIQPIGDSYERPFTFMGRGRCRANRHQFIGVVQGRRDPSKFIVVTAHYDHLGVRNGQTFNGADDNASGVAALIAVAERLVAEKPEHSVLFAALDAEESGLNGARVFVKDPPVARAGIVMNINLDMVARDAGNVLYAVGTYHYPFLKAYLSNVARPPVVLRFGHDVPNKPGVKPDPKDADWTRDSDHFPFHEAGIPFIYFGVEDEEQHHKPTDDFETVTRDLFVGAANTILAAIRNFDAKLEAIAARK